ncbi:MAG: hypothetical protein R3C44_25330, partial [Chloroflexota bacterium]
EVSAMSTGDKNSSKRDSLATGLVILVALSLLAAFFFLALGFPPATSDTSPTAPPIIVTPGGNGETGTETGDNDNNTTVPSYSADDLRELALALAAVITAVTGLFGIVATQVWRRREENRNDKTHALELERERLELERERLKLEQDRLELERQRHAIEGGM